MPTGTGAGGSGNNTAGRTVFRPPWVKDGPSPIPMPAAPWTLRNKEANAPTTVTSTLPHVQLKKVAPRQNGSSTAKEPAPSQASLKEVKVPVQTEAKVVPIRREETAREAPTRSRPVNEPERTIPIKHETAKPPPVRERPPAPTNTTKPEESSKVEARKVIEREIPVKPPLVKQASLKSVIPSPPAPPMPPPPPPKMLPPDHKELTKEQKANIEALRSRPRKRPDWGTMMKEVEQGKKLKHVVCNDRSKPLLPAGKAKTKDGQFVYESEKANLHNQLLRQIQGGINLKRVQTNDRSRPILDGLRKFRRQMTIEEQIQKSQSAVTIPDGEDIADEADEMDDIDKIRDDLQSTKQLLALELRNRDAAAKENKRLQARILNLEVELEHEKGMAAASVTRSVMAERIEDDKLVTNLKQEAEDARKAAKESEKKYIKASDVLDTTKGELEEAKRQNDILEKKLEAALKALSGVGSRRESQAPESMETCELEGDESESESDDDDGEENEEKKERRAKRELKLITNKLRNFKDKEGNARNERKALKEQMKKQQELIKEERKKYKHLQREVDKMAALMKEDDENDEEKDDDDEENSEGVSDEEESETETESSSESEEEDDKSDSEAEDAPFEKKKENYTSRVRRHENCLAALKKGNYLLKANIDRLKDDLNKQREMSISLQEDLDSVLAELG